MSVFCTTIHFQFSFPTLLVGEVSRNCFAEALSIGSFKNQFANTPSRSSSHSELTGSLRSSSQSHRTEVHHLLWVGNRKCHCQATSRCIPPFCRVLWSNTSGFPTELLLECVAVSSASSRSLFVRILHLIYSRRTILLILRLVSWSTRAKAYRGLRICLQDKET